jgi:hypothetical protein
MSGGHYLFDAFSLGQLLSSAPLFVSMFLLRHLALVLLILKLVYLSISLSNNIQVPHLFSAHDVDSSLVVICPQAKRCVRPVCLTLQSLRSYSAVL